MTDRSAKAGGGRLTAVLAAVLFLVAVAINALANILPINGISTGAISDSIPNLFVPAGLTFSIWGLIYLLLLGYVATALVQAFRRRGSPSPDSRNALLLSANLLANGGWILAWHFRQVGLSMALMLAILGTLLAMEERNHAQRASALAGLPGAERFFLTVPVNVYLGWICVATIANATAVLVTAGWDGFGLDPRLWTVAVIGAGLGIGLFLAVTRKAVAAPLVIAWAFAGIVLKRVQADMDYSAAIWIAALAAALVLAAFAAGILARGRAARGSDRKAAA